MASARSLGMNPKQPPPRFVALDVSLDLIRSLVLPLNAIQAHDPNLAKQLRNAASSVSLNIAEGRRRVGRDKLHHFRIAAGSADEARVALLIAQAWGYVDEPAIEPALQLADRTLALLYGLTR